MLYTCNFCVYWLVLSQKVHALPQQLFLFNRKLSKLSTLVTILEHASNNINRTTFFENVIKTIKTRRMENDLLTTDLPPTSSYEDGQQKPEFQKIHGLLDPTAEMEEQIPPAVTSVHSMKGMHIVHTLKQKKNIESQFIDLTLISSLYMEKRNK